MFDMIKNPKNAPIIQLRGISFQYIGMEKRVIDQLDFSLQKGDRVGIIAPNGSGKTTLFHLIMGLLKPICGEIKLFGQSVSSEKDFEQMRTKVGLLFQESDDQLFCPTVLEDVAFGPLNQGKSVQEAKEISTQTLTELGLVGFEERITYKLSGGEKRLVALATVLSMKPDLLLLDEPSVGLDEEIKERLINYLNRSELSYLIISHDASFLSQVTEQQYTMRKGKLYPDRCSLKLIR